MHCDSNTLSFEGPCVSSAGTPMLRNTASCGGCVISFTFEFILLKCDSVYLMQPLMDATWSVVPSTECMLPRMTGIVPEIIEPCPWMRQEWALIIVRLWVQPMSRRFMTPKVELHQQFPILKWKMPVSTVSQSNDSILLLTNESMCFIRTPIFLLTWVVRADEESVEWVLRLEGLVVIIAKWRAENSQPDHLLPLKKRSKDLQLTIMTRLL